jgi:PAS domain S-box-containing protein
MSELADADPEYRVLVLAPTAKDAEVSCQILAGSGIPCVACRSLAEVCEGIEAGAGAALVTQEIILSDRTGSLSRALEKQEPWSAFPLIVLTPSGANSSRDGRALEAVGPMTLMKRPVQIAELVSAVRAAVRDRGRQYRARDLLAAIRESEEKFRTLAESIPQLAWMARPDGHIFWYNQRWYDYTGTSPGQMEGWGWREVHDPAELPSVLERWKRSIESGEPFDMVFPIRGADGRFRSFLTRVMPLRGVDGRVVMWFGTNTDVEDQRRAEAELRRQAALLEEARAEAEAANRMKDEFLAILSHELRTPLNAIVGWARILRSGKADAEDLEDGLAAIERNSRVQTQLIEDLLDVSRIASGNLRLEVQRLNLAEVIDAALEAVAPAATAKEIRIVKMLDSLAAPVTGDPARLQQVIWNLLTNAVKFTPKGGQVQVLLERVNSHVEISVIDTGMGIAPEFLPHVFDRFRQADSTSTRRHGGLGLGLSIVKQLVEMHGGTIRAKSPGEGQGATFTVMLPITVVHGERPGSRDAQPRPDVAREAICQDGALAGLRVLVVDDEPDARQLIRRVLAECEAEVSLASSAAEALREVERFRPDVIVSDIGMPEEDGYDLIRKVRANYTAKQIPAAALTAFARTEDRKRALLAGFQTHITKPVDPAELTAAVASLACRTGKSG